MAKPNRPGNKPQKQAKEQVTHIEQRVHQGPIPDPESLARYNVIVPDAAERILKMAENEASHRQEQDRFALEANVTDRLKARGEIRLGQVLAFLLCTFVVACGTYLAFNGAQWPGVVLGSAGLSGIILAYLKR